jgi:hypothetical protein
LVLDFPPISHHTFGVVRRSAITPSVWSADQPSHLRCGPPISRESDLKLKLMKFHLIIISLDQDQQHQFDQVLSRNLRRSDQF